MKLISFLHGGKNSRIVEEFDRPVNGTGYQNLIQPAMSLSLATPEGDDPKLRDYRVSLTERDLTHIVRAIFNPIGRLTLGQITHGRFEDDAALRFTARVASKARLPLRKYISRIDNTDYYTLAINAEHAKEQLTRVFGERVGPVVYAEDFTCE